MRRPGREFGSENPRVIYVALRWNDAKPMIHQEERMVRFVAKRLRVRPTDLRIYNLIRPSKGRGMTLLPREYADLEDTLLRIRDSLRARLSVRLIVVGGRSGPMPIVALSLKLLVPRVRIELRSHHKARAANAGSLDLIRVIRQ